MPRLASRPPQMRRYAGDKARVSIAGKNQYLGKWGSEQAKSAYNRLIEQWRKQGPRQCFGRRPLPRS